MIGGGFYIFKALKAKLKWEPKRMENGSLF
jgi:hypothetical protein